MLTIVWLSKLACKKTLWSRFDPSRQVWVVSDVKSKIFLRQNLLERNGIVIGEPVKRASEFWRNLLQSVDPSMGILGPVGSKITARDFLQTQGTAQWCQRPRAPRKFLEACQNLAQIISHPIALETIAEFEHQNPFDSSQFQELASLGIRFYKRCIEAKRLPWFFVPYYLAEHPEVLKQDSELVFDLGLDMTDGERELIHRLAKESNVKILVPVENAEALLESGLYSYRGLGLGVPQVKEEKMVEVLNANVPFDIWRCSSPDAEARKAVETISKWVAAGIKPESICIAAPEISEYENLLNHDLAWQGIGFQRSLSARLSAGRVFRALNGRLELVDGQVHSGILQEAFLTMSHYRRTSRRRKEKRVLGPVISEDQVSIDEMRNQILKLGRLKSRGELTRQDFESLLFKLYEELVLDLSDSQRDVNFLRAVTALRSEVGDGKLQLKLWIEAWQEITSRIDIVYKQAGAKGIWAVDLASAEEAPATHLIILGSIDTPGRRSVVSNLNSDQLILLKQYGFDLSASTDKRDDSQIRWLKTGAWNHIVLSCPKTDSNGRTVSASSLWLKTASDLGKNLETLDFSEHTMWLDVQKNILNPMVADQVDGFKIWNPLTAKNLGLRVSEEIEGLRQVVIPAEDAKPLSVSLSASKIESYGACPFKFFASTHLRLFDESELDVEPSAQTRGQWLHRAAERILQSEISLELWGDKECEELIDTLDVVQKQVSSDIWPSIRSRFVRLLRRFIQYEIDWRKEYPCTTPLGFEMSFKGYLAWSEGQKTLEFSKVAPQDVSKHWAPFRGSIDRIDVAAQGSAILIDYKSGDSASSNIPSWQKRGSYQLALYAQAIESGLLEKNGEKLKKIIAAQFYSLKKMNRKKGFQLSDVELAGVLPLEKVGNANVTQEIKDKYFTQINESVHECLEHIREGKFTPIPRTETLCPSCSWRTLCRAPHLS
ncbi:MAG: PD-(D/E)XK nuclease family protein [Oligoflexia bacterium]|nr:PD-(D/E)XK nuclease family protein [Oligoflexia bacterium]